MDRVSSFLFSKDVGLRVSASGTGHRDTPSVLRELSQDSVAHFNVPLCLVKK